MKTKNEFQLTIQTDNAAFGQHNDAHEIARILRAVADRLEQGDTGGNARDYNGNSVGEWFLDKKAT